MYELVTEDFDVPAGLEHERFRLRKLTVDDVVKDFDAISSRVDHLGVPKPPFVPTIELNLVDLGWHQKEFELRRSFAYTVVAPDESEVLGCVYLYPSETHDARMRLLGASERLGRRSRSGARGDRARVGRYAAGRSSA